jgi:hypothetical protein
MTPNLYNPGELQRIHDQAKRQAEALREAAVDDFWRGADAVLARTLAGASRSAERLRHALARKAASASFTSLEG